MFDYINERCPHCGETFQKNDDIVVCPECGTPHHRSCYAEHGSCANAARHAEGYDWQQSHTSQPEATEALRCPACGHVMTDGAASCEKCGMPFGAQLSAPRERTPGQRAPKENTPTLPLVPQSIQEYNEAYMEEVRRTKDFDGIPLHDWTVYIGRNAAYYLSYFKAHDDSGRSAAFTLSAWLFPSLYWLYRKLWLLSAGVFLFYLVCQFPGALLYLVDLGMLPKPDNLALWQNLNALGVSLFLGLRMYFGLFAVHIYRSASARKIRTMKMRSDSEQDYQKRLIRASGPSTAAVAVILGAMMLLLMFSSYGPLALPTL